MTRYSITGTYRTRAGRVGTFAAYRMARDGSDAIHWAQRQIEKRRAYAGKLDLRAVALTV